MAEKILIFGNGQMGNLYKDYFNSQEQTVKIAKADITDKSAVETAIAEFEPTVVINTAAKTNLEYCSNNKLEAFNVNVLGADNIAHVCAEQGLYFVHLSSGCIFESKDETDAKTEDSQPGPASYYSWTKVWGEQMLQFEKPESFKLLILRPRQPISAKVSHMNMLVKFLTFTKFVETPNTGTVLEDLLGWTDKLIQDRVTGVLNVANEGWTTPAEIAELLKKHILPELPIERIPKSELDKLTPNKRVDTVLNVDKLKNFVGDVRPYAERLEETIVKLGETIKTMDKSELRTVLERTASESKNRTVTNDVWSKLL